jgi:hypothetical protein
MRYVPENYVAQNGEVLFDDIATPEQLSEEFDDYDAESERLDILRQISVLESQQTPRRIREAALGDDNGWLENLETQISALRSQL